MPVVGREAEIEAVAGVLDAVARGERRLLVLRGEAGIGKTRLLEVVREQAVTRRFVLLEGRATELESDVPLAPVVDALESGLRELPEPMLRDLGEEQLGLLAGVLSGVGEAPPSRWEPTSPVERWRLHRAMRSLVSAFGAHTPVALVLDDVHWSDPATLEFLDHIVRRPPENPHLLALALRPGEAAERLATAQRATGAGGGVALDLPPLDRSAADLLLDGIEAPRERERLFRESGGNPLLLEELARVGATSEVPGDIVAAVRTELRGLSGEANALLEGAAIAGDPFDLDLASAVAGLEGGEALGALDTLVERTLIRPTEEPRRFVFRHPAIRSAVYAAVPAGARLAGHEAAALVLAGAPLPVRARHLAHAAAPGDIEAAATLRAAAALVRSQAPAIAADWLLVARRADPGVGTEDLSTLAETLVEAGRLQAALDLVDEAVAAADPGHGEPLVRLAVAGAAVERLLGRHGAARRRLERALEAAPDSGAGAARLMADLALSAYERGDYPGMSQWAQRARSTPGADRLVGAAAAAMLAPARAFAGDRDGADADVEAALAGLDSATDEELAATGELLTAVPWCVLAVERLADGLAAGRRAAEAVRHGGNGPAIVALDVAVASALGLLGQVTEAVDAADQAEQAARITGNDQAVQWALWMRAWVLLEHGDLAQALAAAEESVALAERLDDSALVTVGQAVLGAVHVAHGNHQRGRELLVLYDIDPGWVCRWTPPLVEADLALGDIEAAEAHAERASSLAGEVGLAGARAAAGRAQSLVALHHGDPPRAAKLALEAAADAERIGGALDATRAHLIAGRALAATDREAAIRELTAVEGQATTLGAQRVREEAIRELRRLGRRVGRGGRRARGEHGLDSLTSREREIANLVADGLTNREIADRLFLSEKTIETHLSRVFGKLGVRSRAEVAASVAAPDPE
jgi:DNA-binding NarL/FixJ family response regulator